MVDSTAVVGLMNCQNCSEDVLQCDKCKGYFSPDEHIDCQDKKHCCIDCK